jgi:bifunctional DNase/RNase
LKVFVEELRSGITELGGGAVMLYGLDYSLTMYIPLQTAKKIAEIRGISTRTDERMSIIDLLGDQIKDLDIKELYINDINEFGVYTGILKISDYAYPVVPSEGLLLCSINGSPIYFESELKGVEKTDETQMDYR